MLKRLISLFFLVIILATNSLASDYYQTSGMKQNPYDWQVQREIDRLKADIHFHPPSAQMEVVAEASHYRWSFDDQVRMSVMLARNPEAVHIKEGPHAPTLVGRYIESIYPSDSGPVLTMLVPSDPDHKEPSWSRLEDNSGVALQHASGIQDLWLTGRQGSSVNSNGAKFSGKLVFMRQHADQPTWIGLHEVTRFAHSQSKIEIQAHEPVTLFLNLDTAILTTGETEYRLPDLIDAPIMIDNEGQIRIGDLNLKPLAAKTKSLPTVSTLDIARQVAAKGIEEIDLNHYTGVFLLQSMAELARISKDAKDKERIRELLMPLAQGKRQFGGNFIPYRCGGNAAAILLLEGMLPEAEEQVRKIAEATHNKSPRSSERIITAGWCVKGDKVFIDSAFAVTPFLVAAGKHFERPEWIRDGFEHTAKLYHLLTNEESGLLHQGRGFQGKGIISEDYWSRASGWGLVALASLVEYLPPENAMHQEAAGLLRKHLEAALAVQDEDGMWRQVMDQHTPESYVETSGTGMILYALGVAIDHGIMEDRYREQLIRGLRGSLAYISQNGSVSHTCKGALCPNNYLRKGWQMNDRHAFGAVVMAFAQAYDIGITELSGPLGLYVPTQE